MGNNKPLIASVILILILGLVLNVFVSPFIDNPTIQEDSLIEGLINTIDNGVTLTLPIVGEFTINLVSIFWLGLDSVTDFIVEQLTLLTYIPNEILGIIMITFILSFALTISSLIRGN